MSVHGATGEAGDDSTMHGRQHPVAGRNQTAVAAVVAELAASLGNRLVTSQAVREQHANTTTWIENQPPDAVALPKVWPALRVVVPLPALLMPPPPETAAPRVQLLLVLMPNVPLLETFVVPGAVTAPPVP